MKEYAIEDGTEVSREDLTAPRMDLEDYEKAHQHLIIPCHDVFINHKERILLVNRDNFPAKDILWPIGGRSKRGIHLEDSLRAIVKGECNLDLTNINYLGTARTLFRTSPFNHHGRGTDTINAVYFADSTGEIKLDGLHSSPTLLSSGEYHLIRERLHPYVRDHMDLIIGEGLFN